jgi:uncharacterized protein YoxC
VGEGKLSSIRETASDAVEIVRQLGTPGVRESLDTAKEITNTVKEILEIMRTPEWVRNIENISKVVDKMPDMSGKSGDGGFGDVKGLVQSTKKVMDDLSKDGRIKGQDLAELAATFKEMLQSFKALADELTAVAAESNRSGSIRDAKETASSLSSAYRSARRAA